MCPPPHLITTVLYHMESCKAKGTRAVPEWKSAPFWPLLCSYDRPLLFPDFVKDFCCLPKSGDMFIPGRGSSFVYSKKGPFFRASSGLMFSLFVWISPAKRVSLISRSHVCSLLFVSSYRRFSSWIVVSEVSAYV